MESTKKGDEHDHPDIPQNEIRISAKSGVGRYVRYVYNLMEKDEKKFDEVTLKAAGKAMDKVVPLVELLKRRIKGLHQLNKITSAMEKREDGFERLIVTLEIKLSKNKLTDDGVGYQKPIPESEVEEYKEHLPRDDDENDHEGHYEPRGRGFRGGRRGRGSYGYRSHYESDDHHEVSRGSRGTRGGYRGGRGSWESKPHYDSDENQDAPRGTRGTRGGYRGGRGSWEAKPHYDSDEEHDAPRGTRGTRGGYRGSRGGYRGESRGGYRGGYRGDTLFLKQFK